MQHNPHADYIPGQGCGCALCREPIPEVRSLTPEENAVLRAEYGAHRKGERQELGIADSLGRGPKQQHQQTGRRD